MAEELFWVRVEAECNSTFASPFLSHRFSQSNQSAGPQVYTPRPETAVFIHSKSCIIKNEPVLRVNASWSVCMRILALV